jgi:hypothetical protein
MVGWHLQELSDKLSYLNLFYSELIMTISISINNLSKSSVLAALYNNAKSHGMGFLQYKKDSMSAEDASQLLQITHDFDYIRGRVLKVDLSGDSFSPRLYNRDNGPNAAENAIAHLVKKQASDEKNEEVKKLNR